MLILILLIVLIALIIIKAQYESYQKEHRRKLEAERLRIVNTMKKQALSAHQAWIEQGKPSAEMSDELSNKLNADELELSQAKLWQKLTPKQRILMNQKSGNL